MKVWMILETRRDEYDFDCDVTLYETKEKALEYLKARNEVLYIKFEVEYWLRREPEASYKKSEFGIEFHSEYADYCLGLHETEVF